MNNQKIDRLIPFYMSVAEEAAKLSRAVRLQVGAVLVKDGRIISYGWNGSPAGWDNCCEDILEDGALRTKPEIIHAEMNSILKVAKSHENCDNAELFITHSTCSECAKSVLQAGIKRVFYKHDYRDPSGIEILRKGGIEVIKID